LRQLIPMLYVKGMSQRDVEAALVDALGVEQTGRTVITEVCKQLRPVFRTWQRRDLSAVDLVYLFLDGIYLKLRPEDKKAIAVLCAYGIMADGRKVLLHLEIGDKESTACWEAFLEDMKQRGLKTPLLTVIDGNAGCRRAVKMKLPDSLVQRCQVHKMRNIINKLPQVARPTLKKLIYNAFTAQTYPGGLQQLQAIVAEYQERFPAAMKCLAQDIEECLVALKLPLAHRRQTRTTNLLERLFGEGKRRSKIIPRFTSEDSGLALIFAVLLDASEGWHGIRMNDALRDRLQVMRTDPESTWEDPDLKNLAA
jgi:transposase-like protein